ncbi:MAG: SRPBCC family protein [Chryseolinea sp.]
MDTATKTVITVEALIKAPVEKVWRFWSEPKHIMKWNNASDDWHTPHSENDLRKDGQFKATMAARDGSMSFDFGGVYTNVQQHKLIEYIIGDGRKVKVVFAANGNETKVVESFEAESTNSIDLQQGGWQAILDNFKKYTESN